MVFVRYDPWVCVPTGGECDLRACFCALAVAKMLALDIQSLVARSGVLAYIKRCQVRQAGRHHHATCWQHRGSTLYSKPLVHAVPRD